MDPASLASGLMAARVGQTQVAVAAKMVKMNADQEKSVADLLNAAQDNMNRLVSVAAGVGTQLDITV